MTDTVERMVGKGPGESKLETALDSEGESTESGGDRGGLEVPAKERGGQVGGAEGVEAAREGGAGKALPDGAAEPGLLLVVDVEVGGYGPLEALLGQESIGVILGEFLGCYLSVLGASLLDQNVLFPPFVLPCLCAFLTGGISRFEGSSCSSLLSVIGESRNWFRRTWFEWKKDGQHRR